MPLAPKPLPGLAPPARRWPAVLGLALAVLLLHALLLDGLPRLPGGPSMPTRPLQLRQVVLPTAAAAPGAAVPAPARTRPPPATTAEPPAAPAPAGPSDMADGAEPGGMAEAGERAETGGMAEAGDKAEAAPAAWPAGTPLPTYATRLPPPATLQYTVRREGGPREAGRESAGAGLQAQLIWRPEAPGYTLSLGLGAVGWASVGALDAHGLAPERHVETRRGREVRAANFQRQPAAEGGGRITFSGPRIEHPLLPGVQDRLSWLLQLAGVMAADPALAQPGREVALLVVGVRGDATLWRLRVLAVAPLALPAGEVAGAVHLQRVAPGPEETRIDVWLDPARHHLPVRLRQQHRAEGPSTEFELLRLGF
jgi:hypothetical protein